MLAMQKCKRCLEPIPEARLKALPGTKECVECSSVEMNVVRSVITGKTTYSEVEVIKNKDTKEYLERLEGKGRTGFGSMLYRGGGSSSENKVKLGDHAARTMRRYTKEDFDRVLAEVMFWIDDDRAIAVRKLESAYSNEMINGLQRRQIREIMQELKPA